MEKVRLSITFTKEDHDFLKEEANKKGIKIQNIVSMLVREHIEKEKENGWYCPLSFFIFKSIIINSFIFKY